MAWRLLMLRCPKRSITAVGDVAQTGVLAGTSSWDEIFAPYVADRWRLAELKVNYRTPAEIMAVADEVGIGSTKCRAVRSTGVQPWALRADDGLPAVVADAAAEFDEADGTLAVLVPPSRLATVRDAVHARLPRTSDDLTDGPVVLVPAGAKGLEFDSVIVVDPAGIVAEGVRGRNDLYVVLTRATQRLGVVHPGDLPAELSGLGTR
jgi:DNA helicase IV